jgi:hypothetical protein
VKIQPQCVVTPGKQTNKQEKYFYARMYRKKTQIPATGGQAKLWEMKYLYLWRAGRGENWDRNVNKEIHTEAFANICVDYMPQFILTYRKHITVHTTKVMAALSNNPCSFYESYE